MQKKERNAERKRKEKHIINTTVGFRQLFVLRNQGNVPELIVD